MPRPQIGLALGSGSARGWSHIGIIEALDEQGITADIVCGASVGSLVGAAYIAGKISPLKDWVLALKWREIASSISLGLSRGGLVDGDVFKELMVKLDITAPIESYATPFASVATDYATGREIWLREGPVHHAVRASMALPGVFSPAKHDEGWLLDGGLVNPVPVSACRAMGADFVIAVNLNENLVEARVATKAEARDQTEEQTSRAPLLEGLIEKVPASIRQHLPQMTSTAQPPKPAAPGYFEVFESAINIMQDKITRSRLSGDPPDVLLAPRLAHVGVFDFQSAQEAIAEGRACVAQAMPRLQAFL
ncbi:patatin-like phospholipase family protein [Hoeflea sp. TYP-13]|uniref:patatin-like phospholipase family protein n=1 Tax=Hoeflea sp. TYP-13 TaxID=3230023 RepID=UPI0034C5CB38